jgi:hypothetical protein
MPSIDYQIATTDAPQGTKEDHAHMPPADTPSSILDPSTDIRMK